MNTVVYFNPIDIHKYYIPSPSTKGAAGLDLRACFGGLRKSLTIYKDSIKIVPLGFSLEIPFGYEAQIRSRSGLASSGVVVLNSPATIDSDYRGELKVILINKSFNPFVIKEGDRIAQLVFNKLPSISMQFSEIYLQKMMDNKLFKDEISKSDFFKKINSMMDGIKAKKDLNGDLNIIIPKGLRSERKGGFGSTGLK